MYTLFTIPLRRAMVVHSDLAYPEGVAAAEILKVGSNETANSKQGSGLKEIMSGGIVAGVVALLSNGFQVLSGGLSLWFHVGRGMTQFPIGYERRQ
ncbi:OPT/YSL family transporter [Selenomonas ruminantium]|uniref:OPT/YSL family transporter n=1 Tax=Selenomonas ruminantium TaxID=971 RepID=UPI00092FF6EE|nr:OPT/YSL family transporter [Selenomonas ruminantium]